ncbi:hypothetical protein [Salinimicrobium xinjiangense]|uniref:hypothetical protein n=1 Tax=Salinimicrobium xinjiangense TaxID=438596 RepID=UPI00040012D9|nr:hypothetical protein [Salinimicrobium xinjiangense]
MEENFYCINFSSGNKDLRLETLIEYDDQKLLTGEYTPDLLQLKWSEGRRVTDIIRLQDIFNFLISNGLKADFEKEELTGWRTYPVEFEGLEDDYFGFQCLGKCGKIIPPKNTGFTIGLSFDKQTWDGSDFFLPAESLGILCTEKAYRVLEKRKIKNIKIEDIDSHRWYGIADGKNTMPNNI